jgi:hypothetical protein
MVTGIGSAPGYAVVLTIYAALVALGYAARKALFFNGLKTNVIGRKVGVELRPCIA